MGATIPERDDKGRKIAAGTTFGANEYRFRGKGVSGTAIAGTTTNIDLTIADYQQYINGGQVILENHASGDSLTFQVVHPTTGILDQYITDWRVDSAVNIQPPIILPYAATLPMGLILRVVYASTGTIGVMVKINYLLQKDY